MITDINRSEAIKIIGATGEKIISNMLSSLGLVVENSINNFDSEKDLLVDGKKVEVKTCQPYVLKNCFSFKANQLRKCTNVDVLYFVSIPPKYQPDYKWGGWIFRLEPSKFKHYTYKTRYGVEMVGIPIEQDAVIPVRELTDAEIKEFAKYTHSAYAK